MSKQEYDGVGYTYAQEKGIVSAEDFTEAIDAIITAYGGTPEEVELDTATKYSEASYKHLISDGLFEGKMNQLIVAMGGTPIKSKKGKKTEPIDEDDPEEYGNSYAATKHLVSAELFSEKMAAIADAVHGGGNDAM